MGTSRSKAENAFRYVNAVGLKAMFVLRRPLKTGFVLRAGGLPTGVRVSTVGQPMSEESNERVRDAAYDRCGIACGMMVVTMEASSAS